MRFRFRICFLLQPLLYFLSRALNHVPAFLAKPFSRINNSIRIWLADPLLDYVVDASKLCDRFKNMKNNTETIGRRVWMFWYSGFDTAPALVQKCIEQVRSTPDIEMVLLTKDNLESYYLDFGTTRPMLESGRISIQHFSDLLRCYLLKEYGGGLGLMLLSLYLMENSLAGTVMNPSGQSNIKRAISSMRENIQGF